MSKHRGSFRESSERPQCRIDAGCGAAPRGSARRGRTQGLQNVRNPFAEHMACYLPRLFSMTVVKSAAEFLYLFAPLLFAAALSGLVMRFDWFPSLRRPLDAGCRWRGKRLFGDSKTWRGVVVAMVGCIAGTAIQKFLVGSQAQSIARIDYGQLDVLVFGSVMGASAMAGELPNSFVKRRLGIAPGKTTHGWLSVVFYVWDQIDLLMFSWAALSCWVRLDFTLVATSVAVTLLLHPLSSLIGYAVGARRSAR